MSSSPAKEPICTSPNKYTVSSTRRYATSKKIQQGTRTVEAIIDDRSHRPSEDRIARSRNGMHTERIRRPGPTRQSMSSDANVLKQRKKEEATGSVLPDIDECQTMQQEKKRIKDGLEWIEKQLILDQRLAAVEKDCNALYSVNKRGTTHTAANSAYWTDIRQLAEESYRARQEEGTHLRHELQRLKTHHSRIRVKLEAFQKGLCHPAELQDLIQAMEDQIANVHASNRRKYNTYISEEKYLERDLASIEAKIDAGEYDSNVLSKPGKRYPRNRRATSAREIKSSSGTQRDIKTLEEEMVDQVRVLDEQIIDNGGHTGGWDPQEHNQFVHILSTSKLPDDLLLRHYKLSDNLDTCSNQSEDEAAVDQRVARCLRKCVKTIITQNASTIRKHFQWYLDYLDILRTKREVVQRWKDKRLEERLKLLEAEQERKLLESGPNRQDKAKDAKHRTRIKVKLDHYHQQKEEEAHQEREKQERAESARKKANETKRRKEQFDNKQKLQLYKLKKEQQEHDMKVSERASKPVASSHQRGQERARSSTEQDTSRHSQVDSSRR